MTKDEKTLEMVQRAVAQLKKLAPVGVSDAAALKQYRAIFEGPVRWKAGIRTPEDLLAPSKKWNTSFKSRERAKPVEVSA